MSVREPSRNSFCHRKKSCLKKTFCVCAPPPARMLLLVVPALLLSDICTDIDFKGATLDVSNFGGDQYCCEVCPQDDALLCCPTRDSDGKVRPPAAPRPRHHTPPPAPLPPRRLHLGPPAPGSVRRRLSLKSPGSRPSRPTCATTVSTPKKPSSAPSRI